MVVPQELTKSDIVKIIEQLDKLLPSNFVNKQGRGRRKAYSDKSILKLSILLKLCGVSYRGAKHFLEKNPKYMELLDLKNIPPFQTISRRVRGLPLHRINKDVVNLFLDIEGLERVELKERYITGKAESGSLVGHSIEANIC